MDRVYIQRQSCNKLNTYLKNLTKLLSNTFKILPFMLLWQETRETWKIQSSRQGRLKNLKKQL